MPRRRTWHGELAALFQPDRERAASEVEDLAQMGSDPAAAAFSARLQKNYTDQRGRGLCRGAVGPASDPFCFACVPRVSAAVGADKIFSRRGSATDRCAGASSPGEGKEEAALARFRLMGRGHPSVVAALRRRIRAAAPRAASGPIALVTKSSAVA
jgi:hypothetical protein